MATGELGPWVGSIEPSPALDDLRSLTAAWLLGFKSQHTRRGYEGDLKLWLAFCGEGGLDPRQARRGHVDAWARLLEASGASPATLARRLSTISSWYSYLVDEGAVAASPLHKVKRPKISEEGKTPGLTRDELRRLLNAAAETGSKRTVALLQLLAHTGLRINEALSRDIEHLGYDRGHRVLRIVRKGGEEGRTVLSAPVVRSLDNYVEGRDAGPIFITSSGKRMGQPEAWRTVQRVARRAALNGAADLTTHSLRVSFITGARDAGVALEDVQDAVGHADPRTTRRYDRGRHALDRHATYAVTAWLAGDED